jgi:hypothetical protein
LYIHARRVIEDILEIGGAAFFITFGVDDIDAARNPVDLLACGFDIGYGKACGMTASPVTVRVGSWMGLVS